LKPFDPSAAYVDPSSRFKIKIRLGGKNIVTANDKAKNGMVENSDDDYEGTDEMEQYSSDDEYESNSQQERVTTRLMRRTAKLPFSPRKSRLRRVTVIDSDESSSEVRPAQRRSKRIKSDIGFESSSSFSSYREVRKTRNDAGPKKVRIKKPVKPAYGHVHDISDVEYESDDELACLRRHRNICAKCHEGPAHDLLEKFKKRSKNKSSRKKPTQDEFDEPDDEGERLNSLGGWVRWSASLLEFLDSSSLKF
jgi:chromodomain-helicase-DNA-binding protein 4